MITISRARQEINVLLTINDPLETSVIKVDEQKQETRQTVEILAPRG